MACPVHAAAQTPAITADGTMGTAVGPDGLAYTITGGTSKPTNGAINLFHSFDKFSVPAGGSATFIGDPSTTNVLSRVTGHLTGRELSRIDGLIDSKTSMPTANFFLINPAGVVFGSGASLNVGGAVRVSTADNIRLEDGVVFSATPVAGEVALLTSAAPQAFGFLSDNPASITVEAGAMLSVGEFFAGQTLSLVGGDVHISGASLSAPGGLLQIASVASPGNAVFSAADIDLASFPRLGLVTISDFASLTAGTNFLLPNGTVQIRSGRLVVDGATLLSDTFDLPGAPLGIDLRATESIEVRNGALIQTMSFFDGDASGISIGTDHLAVTNATIESVAFGEVGRTGTIDIQVGRADIFNGTIRTTSNASAAGNITIGASGTITLAGPTSEISSACCAFAFGGDILAGNISLTAADVILRDQARIRSGGLSGEQAGEKISIAATNTVSISGLAGISSHAFTQSAGAVDISASALIMDGGFVTTSTFGAGDAGQVSVNVNSVGLRNGAQIASSSQLGNLGAGGSITIDAPGSVSISGTALDDGVSSITFSGSRSSGLFSTAEGTGNAGQIAVSTPTLTVADGGRISVATDAGGNAGTILTNVGSFSLTSGARVDSSTTSDGAGGAITVNARDVSVAGLGTGLFSTASSTGNAGQIGVSAQTLTVADGGRISVVSEGAGNAGSVVANVGNVTVTGGGRIESSTSGAGAGGPINVTAASQVEISNGGSVRADSFGAGATGNITIAAGDQIVMTDGSISTRAVSSDGGNVVLIAPNIIRLNDSQITTSVESGAGGGGNIFIDPQFVVLNGSTITANAFGGPGGNITIVADNFLADPGSFLQASSALSTPGTVQVVSPENNVAGSIAQLPRELVDASRLLRGGCSARRTGAPSSFMVAGRGGVPVDPDGYLPSFGAGGPAVVAARAAGVSQGLALAMAGSDCWP